jgi:hypothetical protein
MVHENECDRYYLRKEYIFSILYHNQQPIQRDSSGRSGSHQFVSLWKVLSLFSLLLPVHSCQVFSIGVHYYLNFFFTYPIPAQQQNIAGIAAFNRDLNSLYTIPKDSCLKS